jgi:hypothetical protein
MHSLTDSQCKYDKTLDYCTLVRNYSPSTENHFIPILLYLLFIITPDFVLLPHSY